tara:strand:+ start:234 stop:653 length:420 start_codon:yes stop_codon:yes gene_type:complete
MALTVSKFDRSLGYIMAVESDSTNSLITDAFAGNGKIYSIDFDNTSGSNTNYLKLYLSSYSPVLGSTAPDIILRCLGSTRESWTIPEGIPFTSCSFATTLNAATSDTTASAGTSVVRITASTEETATKTYSPLIALTTE